MRKLKIIHLLLLTAVMIASAIESQALASGRRLTQGQIYQVVERHRIAAGRISPEKARRESLKSLKELLESELKKGLPHNDKTLFLVNRFLLQVEQILGNDCKQAYSLITSVTEGNSGSAASGFRSRDVREGLYLYQAICR